MAQEMMPKLVDLVRDQDLRQNELIGKVDAYLGSNDVDESDVGEALHAAALNNDPNTVFYIFILFWHSTKSKYLLQFVLSLTELLVNPFDDFTKINWSSCGFRSVC